MTGLVRRWTISNTEIASLSVLNFTGRIKVIDSKENCSEGYIRDLLGLNTDSAVLGFDTEAKPKALYSAKRNQTALIQLASENACVLWRTVGTRLLPEPVANILKDPNIVKIGQGVGLDLKDMREDFSNMPSNIVNLIDLHKVASKLNSQPKSLQGLVGIFLRKRLLKDMRLSNWEDETLRMEQIQYASIDAWAARSVYLEMVNKGINVKELGSLTEEINSSEPAPKSSPSPAEPERASDPTSSAQVQLVNLCIKRGFLLRLCGFEKLKNNTDNFKCVFEIIGNSSGPIRVESSTGHSSIRSAQEDAAQVALKLLSTDS
jgi:hypothetical protein